MNTETQVTRNLFRITTNRAKRRLVVYLSALRSIVIRNEFRATS